MKRLLFIDNETYHNPWFLNQIREQGYEIGLVTSKEQYETEISGKYDMVLMADLHIKRREQPNGELHKPALEILADLKERGIPVLVLARETEEVEKEAMSLGARVLRKPLPLEDIFKELEELGVQDVLS